MGNDQRRGPCTVSPHSGPSFLVLALLLPPNAHPRDAPTAHAQDQALAGQEKNKHQGPAPGDTGSSSWGSNLQPPASRGGEGTSPEGLRLGVPERQVYIMSPRICLQSGHLWAEMLGTGVFVEEG